MYKWNTSSEYCFFFYPGLFVHHTASIASSMQMAVPTPYSTTQLSSTAEAGKKVNQTTCSIAVFSQLPCVCNLQMGRSKSKLVHYVKLYTLTQPNIHPWLSNVLPAVATGGGILLSQGSICYIQCCAESLICPRTIMFFKTTSVKSNIPILFIHVMCTPLHSHMHAATHTHTHTHTHTYRARRVSLHCQGAKRSRWNPWWRGGRTNHDTKTINFLDFTLLFCYHIFVYTSFIHVQGVSSHSEVNLMCQALYVWLRVPDGPFHA